MLIIGCDYHPSFQQISFVDTETGECGERRLEHMEEAEQFYRDLRARGLAARIGLEASGYSRWFERLMNELGFELRIGDAATISTKRVRKHKTDKQDAELLLGRESDWVKNVEAAHGDAVIRQGRRRRVLLVAMPPEQRAPILREYVRIASSGRQHFPLPVGAQLSDFEAIAERYPVYRIDPS